MRKNKTKKKKRKIFFVSVILIAAAVFLLAVFFDFSKTLAFSNGWSVGIWNNSLLQRIGGVWQVVNNPAGSPPAIGWLKSSSFKGSCFKDADYEVYFQNTDIGADVRNVRGSAWFGIGSKPDSGGECDSPGDLPSLGWLDFGTDPNSLCSGQLDCHAAQWHKTGSEGDNYTGYLDGYAHVRSMKENGWVRLRGSNNGEKYAVTMDNNGALSGYAWNSGIETNSDLVGNQGLGWIKMDGLQIAECKIEPSTVDLCEGKSFNKEDLTNISFCSTGATCVPDWIDADHFKTWTCTRGCGSMPGTPNLITPEYGKCGSVDYICDKSNLPDDSKLCASGTASSVTFSAITAKWTCGNDCGEKVECSAASRCGWIETNP